MIEVEVKVPITDKDEIETALLQMGFAKGNLLEESDMYFDNTAKQIRGNDMALRIRSSKNLTSNFSEHLMTYKGPKMDSISMTRKELEMKIESAEIGERILNALGYMEISPVMKLRQYFHKEEMTACVDQVKNLGDFLELEIIVGNENEKKEALSSIISLLSELGYEKEEIIRTSYLSMLQKVQNQ